MEEYFVIKEFDDGYDIFELTYEENSNDYCLNVLEIPDDKLDSCIVQDFQMEITLHELNYEDIREDWYVNLVKLNSYR